MSLKYCSIHAGPWNDSATLINDTLRHFCSYSKMISWFSKINFVTLKNSKTVVFGTQKPAQPWVDNKICTTRKPVLQCAASTAQISLYIYGLVRALAVDVRLLWTLGFSYRKTIEVPFILGRCRESSPKDRFSSNIGHVSCFTSEPAFVVFVDPMIWINLHFFAVWPKLNSMRTSQIS